MIKRFLSVYQDSSIRYLFISMIAFGASLGLYYGVLNNYLYEVLSIGKFERGMVEVPRELPGILMFLIIGGLSRFTENRLIRIAFIISIAGAAGLILTADIRVLAILMIVVFSTGEHIMMPLRQSIAIHASKPGMEGLAMGRVASGNNIGMVMGNYLVPLIFFLAARFIPRSDSVSYYRIIFIAALAFIVIGYLLTAKMKDRHVHVRRRKLYFRKKYTKYYILEIFFGARKQIFLTFAPYVLILMYGARAGLIATLYGIWSFSNIFINPVMGRLIDRFGYKKIIVIDTAVLFFLYLLYGYSHRMFPEKTAFIIVCVVFVLDAILFAVGLARAMYVKTLSESKEEITSTLSTGISINHIVSIVIAVAGGLLWERLGMEVLFLTAAGFSVGSFVFSLSLPKGEREYASDD